MMDAHKSTAVVEDMTLHLPLPSNMSFVNSPPFLTFDISIIFIESIKTLDILPREINAYNETYRLGGITSYVHHRRHYVGYILHNGYFLYYDGTPSSLRIFLRGFGVSRPCIVVVRGSTDSSFYLLNQFDWPNMTYTEFTA